MVTTVKKGFERRRHSRASVHVGVRCIRLDPHEGGVIDEVDMVDLSRSGVGAVSDNWYYPGQKVVVCLPADTDHGKRQMQATVRRCLSRQEPGYRIGLEFDHNSLNNWSSLSSTAVAAA
ncbi:MAG: PilZ domain-containing protein [Phycisphaerae bacterium]|nr:PilZ domain-containing protein [Phycisphaerae bacterium]